MGGQSYSGLWHSINYDGAGSAFERCPRDDKMATTPIRYNSRTMFGSSWNICGYRALNCHFKGIEGCGGHVASFGPVSHSIGPWGRDSCSGDNAQRHDPEEHCVGFENNIWSHAPLHSLRGILLYPPAQETSVH